VKVELVRKDHLPRAIDRSIDFKFLREVTVPVPGAVAPGATGCGYRPSLGQALLPGHQFSPDCAGAGCYRDLRPLRWIRQSHSLYRGQGHH